MMQRITFCFASLLLIGLATLPAVTAQKNDKAETLLQAAQHKQLVEGDLKGAIQLYQQIIAQHGNNRAAAAKALVQMGKCYEKQGLAQARKAYDRVVHEYGDQREMVAEAQARLSALSPTAGKAAANKAASGPTVRQVWAGPDVDVLGALTSDGRYLSFVDWETGDVALRDLVTGQKRRLTNKGSWMESSEFALSPVPSSDGGQVAYTWFNLDFSFDIRIARADGGKPKVLYHSAEVQYLQPSQWSKDGKHLLSLFLRKDRTNQIVLLAAADGAVRVLKTLDWQYPLKMSLSPDGRFIVYDFPPQAKSPDRDIFLLAADGSREAHLVRHAANDFSPLWSPDGKRIVFVSDRTGALALWSLAVVDGKPQGAPELVKGDIGRMTPMGFTDKGALYYSLQTGLTDVYTATFDFAAGRMLEPPVVVSQRFIGSNSAPDWSPDGQFLSYVSQHTPGPSQAFATPIRIRSFLTGAEREILPDLNRTRRPRWWPDGRALVIASSDAHGRQGIFKVDAHTGAATPLVELEPASYGTTPAWSSDGKRVFYTYPKGKDLVLRMRNLESGEEKELYPANALNLAVSPDDQWLAFTTPGWQLMLLPLAGGSPRALLQVPPTQFINNNAVAWTRDGRYLLYVLSPPDERSAQPSSLWRIPATGGAPQRLELTMEGLANLRVHPDGRRIAFSAGQSDKAEVWVMENFLSAAQAQKTSVSRR